MALLLLRWCVSDDGGSPLWIVPYPHSASADGHRSSQTVDTV